MKNAFTALNFLCLMALAACGTTPTDSAPISPTPIFKVQHTDQQFPYSGDVADFDGKSDEEIRAAMLRDYPQFDPIFLYETGDESQRAAILEHFGTYVSSEQMNALIKDVHAMNELPVKPMPQNQACDDTLFATLKTWPQELHETKEDKLRVTCVENEASYEVALVYNEEGELIEALKWDPEVDMSDGVIFEVATFNPEVRWGAFISADQMAYPHIFYYYEEE